MPNLTMEEELGLAKAEMAAFMVGVGEGDEQEMDDHELLPSHVFTSEQLLRGKCNGLYDVDLLPF